MYVEDPHEWMLRLFEDEYCAECYGDERDHDAIPFMGNWFARCKPDAVDRRERITDCEWGAQNGYGDCAGPGETVDGHVYCEVHADAVESGGRPEWLDA